MNYQNNIYNKYFKLKPACRRYFIVILGSLFVSSCTHIGPGTVPQDRFDYNQAVSDSWKEQTLLNIVKIRYSDMPLFMDVASIVSGYTLESSINLGGNIVENNTLPNTLSLGAAGKYTDRPTITYAPITGDNFNKKFMTPIPPSGVLFMLQAGWPAEIILPLTLKAINGLYSQKAVGMNKRAPDDNFYRVIHLVDMLQDAGAIGMRVLSDKSEKQTTLVVVRRNNMPADVVAAEDELTTLLGLQREAKEYTVVFGEISKSDTEFAMLTRSLLSMMVEMAGQIDVPVHHITEGRTLASLIDTSNPGNVRRLINIHSSKEEPGDAFVSVRYKDYWYWISDRDFQSKRIFAYLMILFSLTESGGKEGLPLVTIPAG